MKVPLNLDLMRQPANWIIVPLVVMFGTMLLKFIIPNGDETE